MEEQADLPYRRPRRPASQKITARLFHCQQFIFLSAQICMIKSSFSASFSWRNSNLTVAGHRMLLLFTVGSACLLDRQIWAGGAIQAGPTVPYHYYSTTFTLTTVLNAPHFSPLLCLTKLAAFPVSFYAKGILYLSFMKCYSQRRVFVLRLYTYFLLWQ